VFLPFLGPISHRDAARFVGGSENAGSPQYNIRLGRTGRDRKIDTFESRVLTFGASVQCSKPTVNAHPHSRSPRPKGRLAGKLRPNRNPKIETAGLKQIFEGDVTE
jgi:hypothetical protein